MWLLPATSYQTANAMITIRSIAAIPRGKTVWDEGKGAVAGFGARRQTGEAVAYVLKYRTAAGRQRWHTIGRHGAPWTPDLARTEARRVLGEVTKGSDPAEEKQQGRKAKTVAELCDGYLEASAAGRVLTRRKLPKKPSTLATDRGRIERHIKPLLGNLKVAAVSRTDIERFNNQVSEGATAARVKTGKHGLARVTGGRGTATRTLALLGVIFSYAVRQGLRADNPAHGIETHAYNERQRRATNDEYAALGEALRSMPEPTWPIAVAMARFLALSGWRRGEALALTWSEVDLATRTARLKDTKTGASLRPLSHAACEVLRALPRLGELVFPASIGADKLMRGFHKVWLRVAKRAKLPLDVTPHTLRHSFASVAADLGFSELTIAALLGHKKASVTAKYAHHADAVLLQAADAVADRIAEVMGDVRASGVVVEMRRQPA
jgi:integrase